MPIPANLQALHCLAVSQPIGTLYLTAMTASDLLKRVAILRRGLSPETQGNVQRQLSGKRAKDIAAYIQDPDATFPTSIIVAADASKVHPISTDHGLYLVFGTRAQPADPTAISKDLTEADLEAVLPIDANEKIGEVIDGQHRLEGLKEAGATNADSPTGKFELPIVFMLNMEPEERAYVFSTINSKQTPVSSSLIYDLFGLAKYRSPRRTCHEIARALNAKDGSPFYQTLKMLGKKTLPSESLTQGSFSKYVLQLISRTPDDDERSMKLGRPLKADNRCPLRPFFIDERDDFIAKILENYFLAIQRTYPVAWRQPDEYVLRRTVGFAALTKAFKKIWEAEIASSGNATFEAFEPIVARFKESVDEESLRDVESSEGAANALAARFTESWQE